MCLVSDKVTGFSVITLISPVSVLYTVTTAIPDKGLATYWVTTVVWIIVFDFLVIVYTTLDYGSINFC